MAFVIARHASTTWTGPAWRSARSTASTKESASSTSIRTSASTAVHAKLACPVEAITVDRKADPEFKEDAKRFFLEILPTGRARRQPGWRRQGRVISSTPRWWRRTDGRAFGYADTSFGQLALRRAGAGTGDTAAAPDPALVGRVPRADSVAGEQLPSDRDGHGGFGASASLPAPQTIEDFAQGAWELLDALGVDRPPCGATPVRPWRSRWRRRTVDDSTRSCCRRVRGRTPSTAPVTRARAGWTARACPGRRPPAGAVDLRRPYYPDPVTGLLTGSSTTPSVRGGSGRGTPRVRSVPDGGTDRLVTVPVLLIGAGADPFSMPALPKLRDHLIGAPSVGGDRDRGRHVALVERHGTGSRQWCASSWRM